MTTYPPASGATAAGAALAIIRSPRCVAKNRREASVSSASAQSTLEKPPSPRPNTMPRARLTPRAWGVRPIRPDGLLGYSIARHRGRRWRLRTGRSSRADLAALAAGLERPPLRDAVALHGVSLLASAGRRAGFEVRALPRSLSSELRRYFFVGLLAVHHPEGWRHVDRIRRTLWPAELWMSASALRAHSASMNG